MEVHLQAYMTKPCPREGPYFFSRHLVTHLRHLERLGSVFRNVPSDNIGKIEVGKMEKRDIVFHKPGTPHKTFMSCNIVWSIVYVLRKLYIYGIRVHSRILICKKHNISRSKSDHRVTLATLPAHITS